MDCSEIQELIPRYCAGELDDETRRRFEEHCAACPDCRTELEREQSMRTLMNGGSSSDPPEDYWDGYNGTLRQKLKGVKVMLWKLGLIPGLIAGLQSSAVGLVAFALLFVATMHSHFYPSPSQILILCIVVIASAVFLGLRLRDRMKGMVSKVEQQTDPAESRFRRALAATPLTRGIFLTVGMLVNCGLLGLIVYMVARGELYDRVPRVVSVPFGSLWLLNMVVGLFESLRAYLDGRPATIGGRRFRILSIALTFILLGAGLWWGVYMRLVMNAPLHDSVVASRTYDKGDVKAAISIVRNSISRNAGKPKVLACYGELGYIYAGKRQTELSRATYLAGIRAYKQMLSHPAFDYTKSDRMDLYEYAAQLYTGLDQPEEAHKLYRARLLVDPDDPDNMETVAEDYEHAGYIDEARVLYTRVITEHPRSIWTGLAQDQLERLPKPR